MQRQDCWTLLCLLRVSKVLTRREALVQRRWQQASQAVSVGLHCSGQAVLGSKWGMYQVEVTPNNEGSGLHLFTTGSKEEDRSCGRAVSVLAQQRSGWSRDLVEPRLLSLVS